MKVLFDCRYTRLVRHDGISRYTAGLVDAFSKLHPVTMLISDEEQLTMLPDLPWLKIRPGRSLLEPWVALAINRFEPDVVYSPMQTIGSAHRKFRLILTLHDMVFYRNRKPPREFSWFVRAIWWGYHFTYVPQRMALNRAEAVVTGSYNCHSEMVEARLTKRPISVIRPGVDANDLPPRRHADVKSLVYMGTFMPNKNVETLARGMRHLPGYRLHLLSRIDEGTRSRLAALAPDGAIVFENGVSDERYLELLRSSTAMVSACLDEGFGIPLIEALAAATPLVISDIPVFREVGGAAATFFDATSPEGFAAAVLAMDEPERWNQLAALALDQANQFTWQESARRLLELIETLPPRNRKWWKPCQRKLPNESGPAVARR
ncbi:MAG: mannosyltransferase [Microbacteriaceae bacterium]|nr:mannosyltransferase [Microbacteriaceae bacterium]HEV7955861.1 glycosyltransferase family 1 protein [Marisediminicola sp.]